MKLLSSKRYTFISSLVIFSWIVFAWIAFYPTKEAFLGELTGLIFIYIYTLIFVISLAIIVLFLRAFRLDSFRKCFLYNFTGTLNWIWGLIGLVMTIISGGPGDNSVLFILISFCLGYFIHNDMKHGSRLKGDQQHA
jgi:membrane protease YdiL (CAAX protease family)